MAFDASRSGETLASRLGHTSTRMVEKHYVTLFEGLDREIASALEKLHTDLEKQSERLRG